MQLQRTMLQWMGLVFERKESIVTGILSFFNNVFEIFTEWVVKTMDDLGNASTFTTQARLYHNNYAGQIL